MFRLQKPRIVPGTLNVRRLASIDRLFELQEELAPTNIDAITLTELRWRGTNALDLNDSEFRFYHAGSEESVDPSGTGFLIKR
ncbi:hypothetical protein QR680_006998 [Steinernema hermaphroditum]|uniref:Endonuclease/exonuclease/phosphatase domain-containing protein n=1 Tax=Steinernema hermaphroditum TaxID=289476 RepID=A0AA39LYB8_9BILA|nr:hypothetical protein QR680_006998 [Steinernema hermaphroditum]